LANVAREAGLDDRQRGLARTESGQAGFTLNDDRGALGLLIHFGYGDSDIERVLAPFD
jgi:hypothetical protein